MVTYVGSQVNHGYLNATWVIADVTHTVNGATAQVTVKYSVRTRYSRYDRYNKLSWSDYWGRGDCNAYINHGSKGGQTTFHGPITRSVPIRYGSGTKLTFNISFDMGPEIQGVSYLNFDYMLPARAGNIPDAPVLSISEITQTSARLKMSAPKNNGGVAVTQYSMTVTRDNKHPSNGGQVVHTTGSTNFVATGLTPGRPYFVWVGCRNDVGWSKTVSAKRFDTRPPVFVKVAGVWREAAVYVKVGSTWKNADVSVRAGNAWRNVLGK